MNKRLAPMGKCLSGACLRRAPAHLTTEHAGIDYAFDLRGVWCCSVHAGRIKLCPVELRANPDGIE
eukprot:6145063-Alexandrium_andersonii.AAC.1